MRFTKTLIAAAAISTVGMTATAGGLAPAAIEPAPVVVVDPVVAPVGSLGSLGSGYVALGVLGALVAASGSF